MAVQQLGQGLAADAQHLGGGGHGQARRVEAQFPDDLTGVREIFHRPEGSFTQSRRSRLISSIDIDDIISIKSHIVSLI